jgi:hypothetical protein
LSRGTTIGYRKLDRFAPVTVQHVRLTVADAMTRPDGVRMRLFAGS